MSFRWLKYNCWQRASFQDPATSHLTLLPLMPCWLLLGSQGRKFQNILGALKTELTLLTSPVSPLSQPALSRGPDRLSRGLCSVTWQFWFSHFWNRVKSVFILFWGLGFFLSASLTPISHTVIRERKLETMSILRRSPGIIVPWHTGSANEKQEAELQEFVWNWQICSKVFSQKIHRWQPFPTTPLPSVSG